MAGEPIDNFACECRFIARKRMIAIVENHGIFWGQLEKFHVPFVIPIRNDMIIFTMG